MGMKLVAVMRATLLAANRISLGNVSCEREYRSMDMRRKAILKNPQIDGGEAKARSPRRDLKGVVIVSNKQLIPFWNSTNSFACRNLESVRYSCAALQVIERKRINTTNFHLRLSHSSIGWFEVCLNDYTMIFHLRPVDHCGFV